MSTVKETTTTPAGGSTGGADTPDTPVAGD